MGQCGSMWVNVGQCGSMYVGQCGSMYVGQCMWVNVCGSMYVGQCMWVNVCGSMWVNVPPVSGHSHHLLLDLLCICLRYTSPYLSNIYA